jgi:hypothetical protein
LKEIDLKKTGRVIGSDQGMLIKLYLSDAAAFLEFAGSDEESAFFDASEIVAPGKVLLSGAIAK